MTWVDRNPTMRHWAERMLEDAKKKLVFEQTAAYGIILAFKGNAPNTKPFQDLITPYQQALNNAIDEVAKFSRMLGLIEFPTKIEISIHTRCDGRCTNAKGWDCKCICCGLNHGKGNR